MKTHRALAFAAAAAALCTAASGQTIIHEENFDEFETSGWTVNGSNEIYFNGNPANHLGTPLMDFWGITLANDSNPAVIGDLTRHGGPIEFSVDIRVFELLNFFEEQMDPGLFPIVLQLTDYTTPNDGGPISVYVVGEGMPSQSAGWVRYTFTIPDPTSLTLPPGWGGTGAEDPNTFEPILPPGQTYRSVLEHVDELKLTTFVPGYFYSANFWEVGFDTISISVTEGGGGGCPVDWNNDEAVNSGDISAFLTAWIASVQAGDTAGDFDGSGQTNSGDISSFLTAWIDAVTNGC